MSVSDIGGIRHLHSSERVRTGAAEAPVARTASNERCRRFTILEELRVRGRAGLRTKVGFSITRHENRKESTAFPHTEQKGNTQADALHTHVQTTKVLSTSTLQNNEQRRKEVDEKE
jgi:hypothetical protein